MVLSSGADDQPARPDPTRSLPENRSIRRPSRSMAKRARGTHTRPGQRARLQRRGPITPRLSSPVATPSVSLTPEDEARAAELEAEIVAAERQAERSLRSPRDRTAASPD